MAAVRDAIGPELAAMWDAYLGGLKIGPALDALRSHEWDDVMSVLRSFRSGETWLARFARNGRAGDARGPGLPFVLGKGFGKMLAEYKANHQPTRPEELFLKSLTRQETIADVLARQRELETNVGSAPEEPAREDAPAVVDARLLRLGPLTRRKILGLPPSEREAAVAAALAAVERLRARVAAVRTEDTAEAA